MSDVANKKRPPAYLFALGHEGLPETVTAEGVAWRFVKLFKHDFFAATGLYEQLGATGEGSAAADCDPPGGGGRLAVLKVQRVQSWYGYPMRWLGRRVAGREIRIYQELRGAAGVPGFLGRVGETGFLHVFVPGEELREGMALTGLFFEQLKELFESLHAHGIAYVDSNKRENILVGEDGRPWLIDFQISYTLKQKWNPVAVWWYRRFVRADWYHFYKHKTRLLPEGCSAEDFEKARRRGFLHEVHRKFSWPFRQMRRRYLARYDLAKTR